LQLIALAGPKLPTKFQKDRSSGLKVIAITKIAAKIQDGGIKPEVEIKCVP
jgi:hypothetical protein